MDEHAKGTMGHHWSQGLRHKSGSQWQALYRCVFMGYNQCVPQNLQTTCRRFEVPHACSRLEGVPSFNAALAQHTQPNHLAVKGQGRDLP